MIRTTATTAFTPLVWGTTYLVTTELLPPGRPLLDATVRALPAGLLVLAATRTLPRGHWWWRATVLGALNIGGFFALLFVSAYRLPGGVAATLGAVQPLLVAALAFGLLGERPGRRRLGWAVVGAVGVAMVVLRPAAALDGVGLLAGLAGAASMATGMVLTKRWGRPVPLMTFTGWQLAAGGLLLVPLTLVIEGAPPALDLPAVAGFGWLALIGTLLAYAVWFRGLEKLPVMAVSLLGLLSPLVATVLGWAVLGQSLTGVQLAGFVIAIGAVVAGQLPAPVASGSPIVPDPEYAHTWQSSSAVAPSPSTVPAHDRPRRRPRGDRADHGRGGAGRGRAQLARRDRRSRRHGHRWGAPIDGQDRVVPVLVLFFTDGGFANKAIRKLLTRAAEQPVFWQFVGIGRANHGLLAELDVMPGRLVDNAGFFACDGIDRISDEQLYHRLLGEFPDWQRAARTAGVLG